MPTLIPARIWCLFLKKIFVWCFFQFKRIVNPQGQPNKIRCLGVIIRSRNTIRYIHIQIHNNMKYSLTKNHRQFSLNNNIIGTGLLDL